MEPGGLQVQSQPGLYPETALGQNKVKQYMFTTSHLDVERNNNLHTLIRKRSTMQCELTGNYGQFMECDLFMSVTAI